ncbi:MAG: hypothetical protein Q4C39_04470 [Clostridia bacterium]|nr:hypothetical protein [Clostridia bacterium]
MIESGQFLNFIPPKLDGNSIDEKRRYMIVAKNDSNRTIEMINISKISGKNSMNLIKDYNVILNDYCPLRLPSFAKTNTLYKIEYFEELENYICFNGRKLNDRDFLNIIAERQKYVKRTNKNNIINFSKEEFLQINNNVCTV